MRRRADVHPQRDAFVDLATTQKPFALRASGGNSILGELSQETVAVDIEDALRRNAAAMAARVHFGSEFPHPSIKYIIRLIGTGMRHAMCTLAVTGVGKDMARVARCFGLASRIAAELGARYVKTCFVEDGFERDTAGFPVPIVIAGGKKVPELDALDMACRAIDQGASGIDMGRNIFQAEDPVAMIQAVAKVLRELEKPDNAIRIYNNFKAGG